MRIQLAEKYRASGLAREAEGLLSPCVQCGQCTFTCPTFRVLDDEWDGPRGRIYLIKQMLEGVAPDASRLPPAYSLKTLEGRSLESNVQLHLDRCLTCRSCESSCPQGVRYGRLLDIGRELVEQAAPRPLKQRLSRGALRAVVSNRRRFTAVLRTAQVFRRFMPSELRTRIPERRPAVAWPEGTQARRMLVWQGCVQPALAPSINAAAARVLGRLGIRLVPSADGCCGALAQHMGQTPEARVLMRITIDALWAKLDAGVEAIVFTASGCGAHFRDYGQLLQDDPDPAYREKARRVAELTKDIAEIVADEWQDDARSAPIAAGEGRRVAFQSSCSLQHSQKLNGVVEKLLQRAGFKLLPVAYRFMCCGSAGTYSLLQPEISGLLRKRKLETLLASRPAVIATANIGCLTHLGASAPVPVVHWIELLDEAFATGASRDAKAL